MDVILTKTDSWRLQEPEEELSDAWSINRHSTLEDFSSCFLQQQKKPDKKKKDENVDKTH